MLREDTGRLYELFASLFTETEEIPCVHWKSQQAETKVIIRAFIV